jgi:hypothetical protein
LDRWDPALTILLAFSRRRSNRRRYPPRRTEHQRLRATTTTLQCRCFGARVDDFNILARGRGEYYSLSEFCRCLKQIALFFLPHYTTCRVARRSSVELRKWSRHDPQKNYDVVGSWLGGFLLGGYNRWSCRHSQQIGLRMQ